MQYAPGPMTQEDWKSNKALRLKDPSIAHNWGDHTKICRSVIKLVDEFADTHKHQILVTCGTQGEHVEKSYHYPHEDRGGLGVALDIMFPKLKRRELPEVMLQLLRYPFGGIGIYTEWKLRPDWPSIGGFHVDTRPSSITATWIKEATGVYVGVTVANLKKHFV
jgi:hypothetical protein